MYLLSLYHWMNVIFEGEHPGGGEIAYFDVTRGDLIVIQVMAANVLFCTRY